MQYKLKILYMIHETYHAVRAVPTFVYTIWIAQHTDYFGMLLAVKIVAAIDSNGSKDGILAIRFYHSSIMICTCIEEKS
jgi:hypothetical protein